MSTVDDTDTGSVNSDDFLEPGLCDFEEFYECEDGSLASDDDSFYDADDDVPPKLIQRGKEVGCESNGTRQPLIPRRQQSQGPGRDNWSGGCCERNRGDETSRGDGCHGNG